VVGDLDPALPVYNMRSMHDVVASTVAGPRLSATISGAVAVLALALSMVGLYGVLAFTVGQRRHEIGVRMALGAAPRSIAALVVGQALIVASAGVVAGAIGAVIVVRVIRTQLFGVSPADAPTVIAAGLTFLTITLAASWIPARRAASVSPLTALREE